MEGSKKGDDNGKPEDKIRVSQRTTKGKPPVRFANYEMPPNLNFNSTPMPGHASNAKDHFENESVISDDESVISENAGDVTVKPNSENASESAVMKLILMRMDTMSRQFGVVVNRLDQNEETTRNLMRSIEMKPSEPHTEYTSIPHAQPKDPHSTNPFVTLSLQSDTSGLRDDTVVNPNRSLHQSNPFVSLSSPNTGTRRKLHDLPTFSGNYEDWPMFISTYNETTVAYSYSPLENLMRLQKGLQGKAKESVEAMLVHVESVPEVIEELTFRFGRPQQLVKSQIDKLRKIPKLNEDDCSQLIEFSTKLRNFVAFAKGANVESYLHSPDLLESLIEKLPTARQIDWAYEWSKNEERISIVEFSVWLQGIARVASLVENTSRPVRSNKRYTLYTAEGEEQNPARTVKCYYCREPHMADDCRELLEMSVSQRWDWAKQNNLCFSCLAQSHRSMDCKKRKRCDVGDCNKRHHRLLHEFPRGDPSKKESQKNDNPVLSIHDGHETVLFKVIPVTVIGRNDVQVNTFAVMDDAASMTFMESTLADELELQPKSTETVDLSWLDETTASYEMPLVDCRIKGECEYAHTFVMKNVRLLGNLNLPRQSLNVATMKKKYPQLERLPLKDFEQVKPRILIGLNNASLGYVKNYVKCSSGGPMAIKTPLGWLLYGTVDSPTNSDANNQILMIGQSLKRDYQKLHDVVAQFYELENMGVHDSNRILEPKEMTRARDILQTVTRRIGDRYESGLLWKDDDPVMPDSYLMAERRLNSLEKKKKADPMFAMAYEKAIRDFVTKDYARKLLDHEAKVKSKRTWFLPHFGVTNPSKPGKVRVVFDAAARVANVSLNSKLLKGPDLNQPLLSVIFQFREGLVGVCGDIREMFLQVRIREQDQDSQRFLVMENGVPTEYVMQSMMFGAACSPVTAQYVKNVHAEKYREEYPEAVNAILRNHYVDDYVKSYSSEQRAIEVSRQIVKIHSAAGFELRGFVSNSMEVANVLNEQGECLKKTINLDVEGDYQTEKILGMHWKNDSDELVFDLKFHKVPEAVLNQKRNPTKREMLSLAMSIFDPLGLIADHQVYAKVMIQETFNLPIGWDDAVPDCLRERWYQWQSTLKEVANVRVPRCYFFQDSRKEDKLELHVFVDASESAYAAVAYWRIEVESVVQLSFVAGKTRVAPRKLLTIPRLELQAAVLGLRMHQNILKCHSIQPTKSYYWSDSNTVISWIRSGSDKFKPFVAHRVAEILDNSDANEWSWVPTELNPADDGTRAKFPISYKPDSRWIKGPDFLLNDSVNWPRTPNSTESQEPGELKTYKILIVGNATFQVLPDVRRFSKYKSLLRTVGWMFRAVHNWKNQKTSNKIVEELTAAELQFAEKHICRVIQKEAFPLEWNRLSNDEPITAASELYRLSAYYAEDKLIRVNGRIEAADGVPFGTKKPIILPKCHYLTDLIVLYYHQRYEHQFDETVICSIRQKFWIPSVRVILRKVKARCQLCRIKKAKPEQPMMGQMPLDRLTSHVRPFTFTGLDYFGPVSVVIGRSVVKRWIALFDCSVTRAVHLEVAHDLSTDACILCLRNFMNIRGVPKRIRSDNGTNFVGLKGELCNVTDFFDQDTK